MRTEANHLMTLHTRGGWDVWPAQARLFHDGQDVADPVGEFCLVIDPAQHYSVQSHGGEVYEPVDNLLRGTDQEVSTPAGAAQTLTRARWSSQASAARQVGYRVPVAFVEDVVAGIVKGFLFRWTAHHRARGPHLELPSELLAANDALGLDAGGRLVIGVLGDAGEHHVGVFRGEPGAGGRAAGVHDRREGFLDGLGLVKALDDLEEAALVIEFVFDDPELADDLQPLGGIGIERVMFHD